MSEFLFTLLILVIAFLYASVGHGGASGYLALMGIYGFAPEHMRSSSLLLNLIVSAIAFISFYSKDKFDLKKLLYLLIGSVPASFIGAQVDLDAQIYKPILGVFLIFAAVRMMRTLKQSEYETKELSIMYAIIIGAIIGFASGILGIGGGIILSPILILFRWTTIKEAACISAAFIWVNSLSGFSSLLIKGISIPDHLFYIVFAALIGGVAGSFLGSRYLSSSKLKFVLALVLLFASYKLIMV